jgi:hypothetical protein
MNLESGCALKLFCWEYINLKLEILRYELFNLFSIFIQSYARKILSAEVKFRFLELPKTRLTENGQVISWIRFHLTLNDFVYSWRDRFNLHFKQRPCRKKRVIYCFSHWEIDLFMNDYGGNLRKHVRLMCCAITFLIKPK